MGALTVSIPDDLEQTFRRLTRERYGDKQGRLSRGAEDALRKWCNLEELDNK